MIHENIKHFRKAKGLSQEELAVKLHVVRQTVSKWENGLSVPDADVLIRLANVLGVSVSQLLDSAMEIVELYKCVLVVLDDTCILETDHCDEQTDTCRNCFLQALRHRYCNVLTKSGYGKKQKYNT